VHDTTKAQGHGGLSVCGPSCHAVYSCNESVFRRMQTSPEENEGIVPAGTLKIQWRESSQIITGKGFIVVH